MSTDRLRSRSPRSVRTSTFRPHLTAANVAHFREKGWVKVDDFWNSEETEAIRNGLSLLQVKGRLANVSTEGDGVTHTAPERAASLQLCPLSPELPIFRSIPFVPKVASSVAQLLCDDPDPTSSDECVQQYLSQTFWKPPTHGLGTGYHQDNAYFTVPEGHRGTAMWTATHDANIANGCLRVANGYHKGVLLPHRRHLGSDHHITCEDDIDVGKEVPVEVKAGGAIFFNFNVPHCTGPNGTDKPRAAVAYHFLHSAHFRERAFPLPEGSEYVCPVVHGRRVTNGAAKEEYGRDVATWEHDMAEMRGIDLEAERLNLVAHVGPRVVAQDRQTEAFKQGET